MRFGAGMAAVVLGLVGLSATGTAHAQGGSKVAGAEEEEWLRDLRPERRNGVVLGVSTGIGFAGASGYPNDAKRIDNPAFYSSSPLLLGPSTSIFLMGALSDIVSFGFMVTTASFESSQWRSSALGIGFRVEAFPLYHLVPLLRDTAIYAQLGGGGMSLEAKGGVFPKADTAEAFVGAGVHHELTLWKVLGGRLTAGPMIELDAVAGQSAQAHWLTGGARVVFYTSRGSMK